MNSSPLQRRAVPLSSSSGTSRRTEILPAPAYWNTWSIPSYRSREIGVTNSECSERSKTDLAELTKSASLPWVLVVWTRYRTQECCRSEERRVGKEGVSTCRYRGSPYQ